MLRYIMILILVAVGLPLVMISLGSKTDITDSPAYGEEAFVEQEAPYSSVSL